MTDHNEKPELNPVSGGENAPEKHEPTREELFGAPEKEESDEEIQAKRDELFGDLDDEETPEDIKAERDNLWKKLTEMDSRLGVYQQEKIALTQKLAEQKAQSAQSLAKIRDLADQEKSLEIQNFAGEVMPVADSLGQALNAISKEQRAADLKFDKLAQGVEKTLSQLTAVFNKSSGKTSAPKNTDAAAKLETPEESVQKASTLKERVLRENETPKEIRAERDELLQQQIEMSGRFSRAQQENLSLIKQLAAHKAEAEQVLVRAQNQINEQKPFALEKFLKDVLPVVDNLERGLTAIPQAQRAADAKFESLAQDVEKTLGGLAAVFNKFGITAIDPMGQPFDPDKHEAISTDDSADVESETVVGVAQKGYQLHERIIRPAKVVVKP